MATYSDARSAGGKITTKTRRRFNPYERPPPPPSPSPPLRSPNWFSSVLVPVSRKIASGAARIITNVFESSSEDDSSSSGDSAFEDDAEDGNDHETHGVDELNPETVTASRGHQLSLEKSDTKHVIEQLILQETFSREECERLVKIINSRVLEHSTMEGRENVVLSGTPGSIIASDSLDLHDKAVLEARKWVKERKVGWSPESEKGTRGVYSDRLQNIESNVASPVDMARLYMNARPPWASPSTERTPSMKRTHLIRDGKGESCSPSKSYSLASGSWNIQDEIRRVRAKATENMLQTLSSPKVDLASFSLSPRTNQNYLVADGFEARTGENNSPIGTQKVDGLGDLATAPSTKLDFSGSGNRQDDLVNEASLSKHDAHVAEQKQDSEAIQNEGDYAAPTSHQVDGPDHTAENHSDQNLSSRNDSTAKEYAETQNTNGRPASQASLSSGGISGEIHKHPTEEGHVASVSHGNSSRGMPFEEKCELLSEASVEVPVAYETDTQNSQEELSQEGTDLAGKPDGVGVKRGKKVKKYNTRGKGKGK